MGSTDDVLIVPTDYPTIQLAIDAAGSGDEIIVAPGIYRDVGEAVVNVSGKSIWLHSSDGPDVTFIDGELQRACLELLGEEDQSTVVQGFTIVRGYAPAGGGGIRVNGTPVILDCVVRDNYGQQLHRRHDEHQSVRSDPFKCRLLPQQRGLQQLCQHLWNLGRRRWLLHCQWMVLMPG